MANELRSQESMDDTLIRYRRVLGDDHLVTLRLAHSLAARLRAQGQHERACELNQDTLSRYRRVLGEDHPATLASAENLAGDLSALGTTSRPNNSTTTSGPD